MPMCITVFFFCYRKWRHLKKKNPQKSIPSTLATGFQVKIPNGNSLRLFSPALRINRRMTVRLRRRRRMPDPCFVCFEIYQPSRSHPLLANKFPRVWRMQRFPNERVLLGFPLEVEVGKIRHRCCFLAGIYLWF